MGSLLTIFGVEIESNKYENGKGIIKFSGDLLRFNKDINNYVRFDTTSTKLTSILLPNSIVNIYDPGITTGGLWSDNLSYVHLPDNYSGYIGLLLSSSMSRNCNLTIVCNGNSNTYSTSDTSFSIQSSTGTITGNLYAPCFSLNTPVLLSDGTSKYIQDITTEDSVLCYNEETHENQSGSVAHTWKKQTEQICTITLENNTTLKLTSNHPLMTENGIYKSIDGKNEQGEVINQLTTADKLFTSEGQYVDIKSIAIADEPQEVYNLDVEPNDNFYVGVGDKFILAHNY